MHFKDRTDGGKRLVPLLIQYAHKPNTLVIGLPRGGVVTAFAVAHALDLPLDIVVPRKLGAPHNPELAVGAITEDGTTIFNDTIMQQLHLSPPQLQQTIATEQQEAARRLSLYRHNRPPLQLQGKTVLIIDDGIATGATMQAAIASVRQKGASKIIVAAPVAPPSVIAQLEKEADDVVCLFATDQFWGIGDFYDQFAQTTDQEVIALLSKSRAPL